MDKFLSDESLASEDWKSIAILELFIIIGLLLGMVIYFLNKSENCTPDYCYNDFCIILKEKS